MVTLNIENEQGQFEEVNVSDDFMELCWKQATVIVKQANDGREIVKLIEETTSDNKQRSIIADMVLKQLVRKSMVSLICRVLSGD
jgi:hypothetical protein